MPAACRPGPGPDHARGLSAPSQARAGPFGAPSSHPASRAAAAAAPAATLLKMGRRSRCARPPSRASLGDGSQACARADRPQPWSTRCSASPSTTAWAAPATVSGRSRDTQEPRRSQQLPRERHRAGHGRRAGLRWLRDAPEPNPQHAATGAAQDAHARPCTPPLTPSHPLSTARHGRPGRARGLSCLAQDSRAVTERRTAWRARAARSPAHLQQGGSRGGCRRSSGRRVARGSPEGAGSRLRQAGQATGTARPVQRRSSREEAAKGSREEAAKGSREEAARSSQGGAPVRQPGARSDEPAPRRRDRRAGPPNPARCAARARGWRGRPPAASAPRSPAGYSGCSPGTPGCRRHRAPCARPARARSACARRRRER